MSQSNIAGCLGLVLGPVIWAYSDVLYGCLVRRIFTPVAGCLMRILTFGTVKLDPASFEAVMYGWVLLISTFVLATVVLLR
jgi:hypothetical protein